MKYNSFEGWYYKEDGDEESIAFIPAFVTKEDGTKEASLQIVTGKESFVITYPMEVCRYERLYGYLTIGPNRFSPNGVRIRIHTQDMDIHGWLYHGPIKTIGYSIMGPFAAIPALPCRHKIISMRHPVNGNMTVNGHSMDFSHGIGYIEGDRGRSFPKEYMWTQCHHGPVSLMAAIADFPALGIPIRGIVSVIQTEKQQIRLATYTGAKVCVLTPDEIQITQGRYKLEIHPLNTSHVSLQSPIKGKMSGCVHESLDATVRYRLTEFDRVIFDFTSNRASMEWEYNSHIE